MRTKEDIEQYLNRCFSPDEIEEMGDGIYRIKDDLPEVNDILILVSDPIVIFTARIMKVPTQNQSEFFRKLLEFNATELISGAYGIDGDDIVVSDTLQLENLDYNEFEAALESLAYALHQHYPELIKFADKPAESASAN